METTRRLDLVEGRMGGEKVEMTTLLRNFSVKRKREMGRWLKENKRSRGGLF